MAKKTEDSVVTRHVKLEGTRPLAFDRVPPSLKGELPIADKLYSVDNQIVLPAQHVHAFLCSSEKSATKLIYSDRQIKNRLIVMRGSIAISPEDIPITSKGKPIMFDNFKGDRCTVYEALTKPKPMAPPQLKSIPLVNLPWEVEFDLMFVANSELVPETVLKTIFDKGGAIVGIGTFRGRFGKFKVTEWV